jgi:recombination protein RecT
MKTQEQVKMNSTIEAPKSNGELIKAAMAKATKKGTLAGLKSMDVKTVIESMSAQIGQALPKHVPVERLIQIATTYVSNNPKIAECTASSIIGAIMEMSIQGLEPGLGQCYIVPYNRKSEQGFIKEAQYQIGYKGFIKLAYNSNEVKHIDSDIVKNNDTFKYQRGLFPVLDHIPNDELEDDDDAYNSIRYAYAVIHYKSGGYNFVVLPKNKIEKLRRRSPSQKKGREGAWLTDYDQMAKAKAIKQLLSKYAPLSIEIQRAIALDGAIITEKAFTNNKTGIDISNIDFPKEDIEEARFSETKLENEKAQENDSWINEFDGKEEAHA